MLVCRVDWSGSGQGKLEGPCKHDSKLSICSICRQFLEELRNYSRLKKHLLQWVTNIRVDKQHEEKPLAVQATYLKLYRDADKSLARPVRKQANVSVIMAWSSFGALPCKKKNWWQLASRYCWKRPRPRHASELISFLVGLRTYQHPGIYTICADAFYMYLQPYCTTCNYQRNSSITKFANEEIPPKKVMWNLNSWVFSCICIFKQCSKWRTLLWVVLPCILVWNMK